MCQKRKLQIDTYFLKEMHILGQEIICLREGFQKKQQIIHILWTRGWEGCRMWLKKFLNVNIINFINVDKPEGGRVGQCG